MHVVHLDGYLNNSTSIWTSYIPIQWAGFVGSFYLFRFQYIFEHRYFSCK